MKLWENTHLMRRLFSPRFIRMGQKLWTFYLGTQISELPLLWNYNFTLYFLKSQSGWNHPSYPGNYTPVYVILNSAYFTNIPSTQRCNILYINPNKPRTTKIEKKHEIYFFIDSLSSFLNKSILYKVFSQKFFYLDKFCNSPLGHLKCPQYPGMGGCNFYQ